MAEEKRRTVGRGDKPPKMPFMRGGSEVKEPGKLFKRVWNYMMAGYKWYFVIVVICIVLSSAATIVGTLFMRTLV
ncbi:MAG: ABC transporter ATP-binding protein, partial [Clostridia bacterium]|nr:ABC transporter ATP-binding protein [Clostridia bacterium]